jgi:hypothetical protein
MGLPLDLFPVAIENGIATVSPVYHLIHGSGILGSELACHAPQPGKTDAAIKRLYYNTTNR